jgi:hypothetical protein
MSCTSKTACHNFPLCLIKYISLLITKWRLFRNKMLLPDFVLQKKILWTIRIHFAWYVLHISTELQHHVLTERVKCKNNNHDWVWWQVCLNKLMCLGWRHHRIKCADYAHIYRHKCFLIIFCSEGECLYRLHSFT